MDLPWEQFIIHGPMTVNLLGQLMVVSSKLDFSFLEYNSNLTFIYMRYPSSFRATLTQITNEGWEAFLAAHMNMNRIQQSMQYIPKHVQLALDVLASRRATTNIISRLLPSTLKEIERLGKSCVTWANNTHNTFLSVMNLIGEVISSTEMTRGSAETRLRQTEIELNASRIMQIELNKVGETIRSHYNEARDAVKTAQSEYSRALSRIPTGFKALLLDLGRAVIGLVKNLGNTVMEMGKTMVKVAVPAAIGIATGGVGLGVGALAGGGLGALGSGGLGALGSGGLGALGGLGGLIGGGSGSVANGQALTFGKLFSNSFSEVLPQVKEILRTGANVASGSKNPLELLEAYKMTFGTFLSSLKSGKENSLKNQAGGLIKKGVDLFQEVSDEVRKTAGNGEKIDSQVAKGFADRLDNLAEQARPMAAAESINGAEVPTAPPSAGGSGDSSQNEKFAAQLSSNRLRDAESRYDKIFEHLKQNQEDLAKLMGKIATLDMNKIHYKELIDLLREALRFLSRVREQWGQLVLFFAEVATKAELILSATLTPFINQANQTEGLALDERLFYVDILKAQADDIEVQSGMLYTMARTYYDMSTRFIMQRLAGISKMLTASTDNERNNLLAELNSNTQDTQAAVLSLVAERKRAYQQKVKQRRIELANFIAKLGGPDAQNQLAIEAGKQLLESSS
ncbi:unnamed protein product [Rotaria magnacalcarata]|nr:unnamed protein product [Rotaria magnacalcarata]CAF4004742.1 unnamed protein product [Rotaria magnacalcarata]CAF4024583.1 unnamed protein product [Rotaria magnacalcarata]